MASGLITITDMRRTAGCSRRWEKRAKLMPINSTEFAAQLDYPRLPDFCRLFWLMRNGAVYRLKLKWLSCPNRYTCF